MTAPKSDKHALRMVGEENAIRGAPTRSPATLVGSRVVVASNAENMGLNQW